MPSSTPAGYTSLTPYLTVRDGAKAMAFYVEAFGAVELSRMCTPDGKVGHAEMQIGDARFMLSDEFPEWDALSPQSVGGTSTQLMIYTEDADAMHARALRAGATSIMAVETQFYGDRCGKVLDPFGHKWMMATHVEDLSPAEIAKRAQASYGMNYAVEGKMV